MGAPKSLEDLIEFQRAVQNGLTVEILPVPNTVSEYDRALNQMVRAIQNKFGLTDRIGVVQEPSMVPFFLDFIKKHKVICYPNCFDELELNKILYFNTYFDHIYMLNIRRRADRWGKMQTALEHNHILGVERFIGFDGNDEPHLSEWERYMHEPLTPDEQKHHRKCIRHQGSWAILKSMKRMIQNAKENGFKRILVLQDDLLFHKDFLEKFSHMPVPASWKLLFLGASQHTWPKSMEFHEGFYHPSPNGTADGAFAVGIDSSCYDMLLSEINKFNMPFDSGPLAAVQRAYPKECYILSPNLIIADVRDSDLRRSRSLESMCNTFKWDLKNYTGI